MRHLPEARARISGAATACGAGVAMPPRPDYSEVLTAGQIRTAHVWALRLELHNVLTERQGFEGNPLASTRRHHLTNRAASLRARLRTLTAVGVVQPPAAGGPDQT